MHSFFLLQVNRAMMRIYKAVGNSLKAISYSSEINRCKSYCVANMAGMAGAKHQRK